jgi:hypothetical protein
MLRFILLLGFNFLYYINSNGQGIRLYASPADYNPMGYDMFEAAARARAAKAAREEREAIAARSSNPPTCQEIMTYLKSEGSGTTYLSINSDAISKVTFYDCSIEYETYYFAIVCFKREYSLECAEYVYQVGSDCKMYYSMNYLTSAGAAFWKYIHPCNKYLQCAPDFE